MKSFVLLSALLVSVSGALAGGGGGPFSDYSPLQTGIDGTYQATARGANLTGIIKFAYNGGSQTQSPTENNWIFFVGGQIITGSTSAALDDNTVTGILDSQALGSLGGNGDGTIDLPQVIVNNGTSSAGTFEGTIDQNKVGAPFSGEGAVVPSPASTNQIISISGVDITDTNFSIQDITVSTTTITNAAGTIPATAFTFSGYRTSTLTSGANANSSSTNSSTNN